MDTDFFEKLLQTKINDLHTFILMAYDSAEVKCESVEQYDGIKGEEYYSWYELYDIKICIRYIRFYPNIHSLHSYYWYGIYTVICFTNNKLVYIHYDEGECGCNSRKYVKVYKLTKRLNYDKYNYMELFDDIDGLELINKYKYFPDKTIKNLITTGSIKSANNY